jgi:hypothetical protein
VSSRHNDETKEPVAFHLLEAALSSVVAATKALTRYVYFFSALVPHLLYNRSPALCAREAVRTVRRQARISLSPRAPPKTLKPLQQQPNQITPAWHAAAIHLRREAYRDSSITEKKKKQMVVVILARLGGCLLIGQREGNVAGTSRSKNGCSGRSASGTLGVARVDD